jgi:hypothetical protein
MKRIGTILLAATITAFGTATVARADNTTAANANFIFMGEVQEDVVQIGTLERWYKVELISGRSYCFYVWAPSSDPSEAPVNLDSNIFLDDGVTTAPGQTAGFAEPTTEVSSHNGDVQRIIPTSSQTFRYRVVQGTGPANPITIHVLVLETTQFSPWYFRSAANGYDGFIEMRNSTDDIVSVTVTVYTATGTVPGTPSTVAINANGTALMQVSTPGFAVPPDSFGSVQIAHNGAPGAITANLTTLSAMTGLSFDAPFTPRMTWGTMKR